MGGLRLSLGVLLLAMGIALYVTLQVEAQDYNPSPYFPPMTFRCEDDCLFCNTEPGLCNSNGFHVRPAPRHQCTRHPRSHSLAAHGTYENFRRGRTGVFYARRRTMDIHSRSVSVSVLCSLLFSACPAPPPATAGGRGGISNERARHHS